MTGRTATATYAVIDPPAVGDLYFTWTATIYRKGFKRTETLLAYSEQHLLDQCRMRGVSKFRAAGASESVEAPPI